MTNYNKIYDEEIYKLVNNESKLILEDYMLELEARKLAVKSRQQYLADLKMFLVYTQQNINNKSILDLKKRDYRNFFLMMSNDGKSSARINRVQSSIRNLLEFVVMDDDEYPDFQVNAMKKIKGVPKETVREIVFLTADQVEFLFEYLLKNKMYQKALYLSISLDSAGRRNEVYQVTKTPLLEKSNKTNVVEGKRGKKFPLMLTQRSHDIFEKYIEQRGDDDIESLWITGKDEDKRELGYDSLYNYAISFRAILEAEFEEDIPLNSHSLRHTSLELYETGDHYALRYMGKDRLDINTLRILANHEDISITQSYLRNKDSEVLDDLFS